MTPQESCGTGAGRCEASVPDCSRDARGGPWTARYRPTRGPLARSVWPSNTVGAATLPTEAPATTTSTAKLESADSGDLKAKLLAVADMPTGYSEESPEEEKGEEDEPSQFCKELQGFEQQHKAPEEAEISFQKGAPSLFGAASLVESLGRFESATRANGAFDAFVKGMQNCKTFEQTDADGTFKGSFSALSFPKLGDDTFAAHLAGSGGSEGFNIDINGDFVAVRKSRVIMLVATITFGAGAIQPAELETVIRKAAAKL